MAGSLEVLWDSYLIYVILRRLQTLTSSDCGSLSLSGEVPLVRELRQAGKQTSAVDLLKAQTHRRKLGHGDDTRLNTDYSDECLQCKPWRASAPLRDFQQSSSVA